MEELLEKLNEELDLIDDGILEKKKEVILNYIGKVDEAYLYLADLYYFDYENIDEALKYYILAGDKKIGQAIYMQGIIYSNAFYRDINIDKAKECLLDAANNYDIDDAIYEIGFNYLNGLNGFEENHSEALKYLLKSANNNNPEALCSLARCYANGLGVEQDYKKAYEYSHKAFLELNNE